MENRRDMIFTNLSEMIKNFWLWEWLLEDSSKPGILRTKRVYVTIVAQIIDFVKCFVRLERELGKK